MQSNSTNRRYFLLFFTIFLICLIPVAILNFDRIRAALGGSDAAPIAHWSFDEGVDNTCSGGTNDVCDSSGNGNDGANSGATWQTEDKCVSGKCLWFDGTNDTITLPTNMLCPRPIKLSQAE